MTEGGGVECERDDVAGPHEEVDGACEDSVAETFDEKIDGAAGGRISGAELCVGVGGEERHDSADSEGEPHGVARDLCDDAEDREDARADHSADADRDGGGKRDFIGIRGGRRGSGSGSGGSISHETQPVERPEVASKRTTMKQALRREVEGLVL